MYFNFSKLLNDAVEGFVFFIYRYVEALYLVIRFPFRGPLVLAYRNRTDRANTLSPHVFALTNLLAGFFTVEIISPLVHLTWADVAGSVATQFDKLQNAELDFIPVLLRALVVLVSIDAAIRLTSMRFHYRRRRELVRSSLLFSFGLQPLVIIVVLVYLAQFNSTAPLTVAIIVISAFVLTLTLASPAVILAARVHGPKLFTPIARRRLSAFSTSVLATILVCALYIESAALITYGVGEQAAKIDISEFQCQIDDKAAVHITGVIENRTRSRLILPIANTNVISASVAKQPVLISSVMTSLGQEAPILILASHTPVWIKIAGRASAAALVSTGTECRFRVSDSEVTSRRRNP